MKDQRPPDSGRPQVSGVASGLDQWRSGLGTAIRHGFDMEKRHGRAHSLGRPGGVLLSHALRRSTIGAEGFHGRVRDGIGCFALAMATRSSKRMKEPKHEWRLG